MADFNGDGYDDLFWYDPASGAWAGHVNRGPGRFKDTPGVWPAGGTVVVGDLDGDGRDGLFFYDAATGAWSRYLTGDSKQYDRVVLVEESGTWATGWTVVGQR